MQFLEHDAAHDEQLVHPWHDPVQPLMHVSAQAPAHPPIQLVSHVPVHDFSQLVSHDAHI